MDGLRNIRTERGDDGVIVVVFDKPDSSANTFDRRTLEELDTVLAGIEQDASCRGVVFASAKETIFVAGADLVELSRLDPDGIRAIGAFGQRVFQRVAALRVPTAAAIHGACLGGGFELALACDWRVASDDKATRIGLPECQLGILPAWGGSTRLPRLVGLPKALDAILGAKVMPAKKAKKLGAVDAVVPREYVVREARRSALGAAPRRKRHWLVNNRLAAAVIRRSAAKTLRRKTGGHYPAFFRALDVVTRSVSRSIERSLAAELDALCELTSTDVCRNLVRIFFLQERAKHYRVPDTPELPRDHAERRVAVIGAGVMGAGIAQWCAARGLDVILKDISTEALARGMATIADLVRGLEKRRKVTRVEARQILDRIRPTDRDVPLRHVDLVIEAAVERMDIKQAIFRDLAARSGPDTVLATNTSALSIAEIARATDRPQHVVGIHFFNPVARMQLVEVVRAADTSPETLARSVRFVQQIGKLPVVVRDSPGFVVNRVLTPYLVEAGRLFAEGVDVEAIDRAMKAFGMPMGPLRLIDEVGGDVAVHVARYQAQHFPDRVELPPMLETMVERGLLGRKAGRGFYVYPKKGRPTPNPEVRALAGGGSGERPSRQELQDRMALAMVNESARCLEERLVEAPEDIDFAMIMGTGFAPFRGGPLRWADSLGAGEVVRRLEELAQRHGPRFAPAELLVRMARENATFYKDDLPAPATDAA
ncbi:MAG: fatty oxidation complex subunit alpha [Acidobacteria bacterium]|nr:MAG: fatty oxidation complex subunit alpha [Acidobacteriota bacterium]